MLKKQKNCDSKKRNFRPVKNLIAIGVFSYILGEKNKKVYYNATRPLRRCYGRLSRLMKPNLVKNTTGAP